MLTARRILYRVVAVACLALLPTCRDVNGPAPAVRPAAIRDVTPSTCGVCVVGPATLRRTTAKPTSAEYTFAGGKPPYVQSQLVVVQGVEYPLTAPHGRHRPCFAMRA